MQAVPLQAVGIGFFFLFAMIALVLTAVWVGVSYWVYSDASDRGVDSPELWGVVTFVGGVIGLVAYVIVREDL